MTAPKVCAHEQDVLDLAWSPFNDQIIASSSEDGTIKIWEIPDGGLLTNLTTPLLTFDYHQRRCSNIQWHPVANNILMSVSQDPSIVVWNLEDGSAVCEIDCHPDLIFNAEFNRNGDKIVTVCKDKKIRIIDARTGNVLAVCWHFFIHWDFTYPDFALHVLTFHEKLSIWGLSLD